MVASVDDALARIPPVRPLSGSPVYASLDANTRESGHPIGVAVDRFGLTPE